MFFIGIMGIGSKQKNIITIPSIICKACGSFGQYNVIKRYNYFHIFFLPLWKWNEQYYVSERMCSSIFNLDIKIGKDIEKGIQTEIRPEDLSEINPVKRCKYCGKALNDDFVYCPYCSAVQNNLK